MDELETKVAEAICARLGIPCDGLNREVATADARAYVAVMREHCGGYEAAARECERLAGGASIGADKASAGTYEQGYCKGQARAWFEAARIIREHAQHVPPVDREGVWRVAGRVSADWHAMPITDSDDLDLYTREVLAAILAHLGAQPAAVPASDRDAAGLAAYLRADTSYTAQSWAAPDTEWAALVAERDGLRAQLSSAETARGHYASALGRIETAVFPGAAVAQPIGDTVAQVERMAYQLAAATKRAEEAAALAAARAEQAEHWERVSVALSGEIDAAEARVRELEARPVRDEGDPLTAPQYPAPLTLLLEAVSELQTGLRELEHGMPNTATRESLARARTAMRLARAALNGEG